MLMKVMLMKCLWTIRTYLNGMSLINLHASEEYILDMKIFPRAITINAHLEIQELSRPFL